MIADERVSPNISWKLTHPHFWICATLRGDLSNSSCWTSPGPATVEHNCRPQLRPNSFYASNIYTGNRVQKYDATNPLYGKRGLDLGASMQPEAPRSSRRVALQYHLELVLTHHAVSMRRRDFRDVYRADPGNWKTPDCAGTTRDLTRLVLERERAPSREGESGNRARLEGKAVPSAAALPMERGTVARPARVTLASCFTHRQVSGTSEA